MAFRQYTAINVVAQPHPEGTYRKIFEKASRQAPLRFRADRYARISPITKSENGVFLGRLATWDEIDRDKPAVVKSSLEEQSLEEAGISFPDDIGFNSKIFYFAFNENQHVLFVEQANDEGRSISSSMARNAFAKVLEVAAEGLVEDIALHIASRKDAVSRVLSIPYLRQVEIDLNIPNPDDLTEDQERVLEKLRHMNAKRLKTEATRASGEETLVVDDESLAMAELAANNGSVIADGKNEDGEKVHRSTKEMPAEIEEEISEDDSSYLTIGRVARRGLYGDEGEASGEAST